MSIIEGIIGPIAKLIDKIIPDPEARDRAKLELLKLQGGQEMEQIKTQLSAIVAEAQSTDPWTSRARPSFARPEMAADIARGMNAYLAGIPEPLYAPFGTGYLGYTAARSWGKAKGIEK